jgi:hypothetical protein
MRPKHISRCASATYADFEDLTAGWVAVTTELPDKAVVLANVIERTYRWTPQPARA